MTMIRHLPPDAPTVGRFAQRRAELFAELRGRAHAVPVDHTIQSDPRPAEVAQGRVAQGELSPREMIPDATLRRWAAGEPEAACGEISADLQRELAMLLPDLCGELLARRALADAEGPR